MARAKLVHSSIAVDVQRWRAEKREPSKRTIPSEVAVALVHDASTTAVMMATPADLEDFAVGFSISEQIVEKLSDIARIEIVESQKGIETRIWLTASMSQRLSRSRRLLVGPTGCGLCGVDSLEAASRPPPQVGEGAAATPSGIYAALNALAEAQALGKDTRAVHGAAVWRENGGVIKLREDVGRHNALDKLIGALARSDQQIGDGLLLLTSRLSVEMVLKAAVIGAQIVVAVSAPTSLAIETARNAGITLVGVARPDGFEVFSRTDRVGV